MFTNLYSFYSTKKPIWVTKGTALPNGSGFMGSSGSINAAIAFGGQWSQGGYLGQTFTWNGSSYAAGASMIYTAWYMASCGNSTQASSMGGGSNNTNVINNVQLFSVGNAWSNYPSLNTARKAFAGAGVGINPALCFGGNNGNTLTNVEYISGSWTNVTGLNIGVQSQGGCGSASAALSVSGYASSGFNPSNQSYNGTSWTTGASITTPRYSFAACGSQTSALAFGGSGDGISYVIFSETWNGASWVNSAPLNAPRYGITGCGTSTKAVCFGGYPASANYGLIETYS